MPEEITSERPAPTWIPLITGTGILWRSELVFKWCYGRECARKNELETRKDTFTGMSELMGCVQESY